MGLQVQDKLFASTPAMISGITSTAPLILNLSSRWMWQVSLTSLSLYPTGKNPRYQLNRRLGGPIDGLEVCRRDVSGPYREPKTKSSIPWPIQDTKSPNIHKPNLCPVLKFSKRLDRIQVPHNWRFKMWIRYVTLPKKMSKFLRDRFYKTTFRKTSLCSNTRCKPICNPLTFVHLFPFRKSV